MGAKIIVSLGKSSIVVILSLRNDNFSSSAIDGVKLDSSEMNSDIHASGDFRASLVVTYAKKAVEAC